MALHPNVLAILSGVLVEFFVRDDSCLAWDAVCLCIHDSLHLTKPQASIRQLTSQRSQPHG